MLGYLGIHCEWKTSGYEVLEYADTLPRLDLILMDIRLPYEDGYGAQQKLRAAERFKAVPIIAVTAEASAGTNEESQGGWFRRLPWQATRSRSFPRSDSPHPERRTSMGVCIACHGSHSATYIDTHKNAQPVTRGAWRVRLSARC